MERAILLRWAEARAETDRLFGILRPDALYERPIAERHRLIFYLGHLEAFDWNLMRGEQPAFHPSFDQLFAFGIDPVGTGLPTDQPKDWPSEAEIREYGRRTRELLDAGSHPDLLLNVAIEHRLMHAETLAYLLHQLPHSMKCRTRGTPIAPSRATHPASPHSTRKEMLLVSAGPVTLGQEDRTQFGWDNEFGAHVVHVDEFNIDRFKVSNREYLQFVNEGGTPPAFWTRHDDQWYWRGMFEEIPLPLDWPVYVSHRNAAAYAEWSGKSLPTEAEWQRAALGATASKNTNFNRWEPAPVNQAANSESSFGAVEMRGNGWEWTSTQFAPFPGFQPFDFYPGYSANFFDEQHYVMLGGSTRTASCMMRPTFRNWFQPDYPYVYAGFRCVRRQ